MNNLANKITHFFLRVSNGFQSTRRGFLRTAASSAAVAFATMAIRPGKLLADNCANYGCDIYPECPSGAGYGPGPYECCYCHTCTGGNQCCYYDTTYIWYDSTASGNHCMKFAGQLHEPEYSGCWTDCVSCG